MRVLVTGGAGYVGSNVVHALLEAGHEVRVIDDLSSGHPAALAPGVGLVVGSCGDPAVLDEATGGRTFDGIMHLAARCSVGESMEDPRLYYGTNVRASLDLLDWAVDRGVPWLIHSSTCAVYGEAPSQPMEESLPALPINPYGATKLAVDEAVRYYDRAYGIRGTSLRYFNAAGAGDGGRLGEDKTPASNLIPRVLAVALGHAPAVEVYGDDYATPDGTGVRDYVHVADLAAAHLAAMNALAAGGAGNVYNLGTATGSSVLQVIEVARAVTGHPIPACRAPRRAGDPPRLIASSARARRELRWQPEHSDLRTVVADAWAWHRQHPEGYGDRRAPSHREEVS